MTELKVRAEQLGIWMIAFNSAIFNTDSYSSNAYAKYKSPDPNFPQQFNAQPRKPLAYINQPSYKTRCKNTPTTIKALTFAPCFALHLIQILL